MKCSTWREISVNAEKFIQRFVKRALSETKPEQRVANTPQLSSPTNNKTKLPLAYNSTLRSLIKSQFSISPRLIRDAFHESYSSSPRSERENVKN